MWREREKERDRKRERVKERERDRERDGEREREREREKGYRDITWRVQGDKHVKAVLCFSMTGDGAGL